MAGCADPERKKGHKSLLSQPVPRIPSQPVQSGINQRGILSEAHSSFDSSIKIRASGTVIPPPVHHSRNRVEKSLAILNVRPRMARRYSFDRRVYPPPVIRCPDRENHEVFGTALRL